MDKGLASQFHPPTASRPDLNPNTLSKSHPHSLDHRTDSVLSPSTDLSLIGLQTPTLIHSNLGFSPQAPFQPSSHLITQHHLASHPISPISPVASLIPEPMVSSSSRFATPIYHLPSQKSIGSLLPHPSASMPIIKSQTLDSIHPTSIRVSHSPSLQAVTPDFQPNSRSSRSPHLNPTDAETQAQLAWLGYRQELFRDWDLWSSLSLSCLNIGTIPGSVFGMMTAMTWGGPSVQFWGYLLGMAVMICLSAVIAEIASAFPAAGAMLTWQVS